MMALSSLEETFILLAALQENGENVEIYLAETYRLKALALQTLGQGAEARISWQDSLGYALSVSESEACTTRGVQPPPDCLDAIRWVAEAREELIQ